MGGFHLAKGLFTRAGEGAFFVAEQFAFDQVFGHGGAVDGDEPVVAPGAQLVNGPGHDLFAGAALAQQGTGDAGGGDFLQHAADFEHLGVIGDQPFQRGLLQAGEAAVFFFQVKDVEGALDDQVQGLGLDRFFVIVVGTHGHRADGVFMIGLAGHDNDLGGG